MPSYTTTLALLTILSAVSTQANPSLAVHQVFQRQAGIGLDPSSIPDTCKPSCLPLNDVIGGSCTTPSCLCATTISGSMSGCLQCALDYSGLVSFESQFQEIYDNYANSCSMLGMPVPSFTFKLKGGSSGVAGGPTSGGATIGTPTIARSTANIPQVTETAVGGVGSNGGVGSTGGNTGSPNTDSGSSNTNGNGGNGVLGPFRNVALRFHSGGVGLVGSLIAVACFLVT